MNFSLLKFFALIFVTLRFVESFLASHLTLFAHLQLLFV